MAITTLWNNQNFIYRYRSLCEQHRESLCQQAESIERMNNRIEPARWSKLPTKPKQAEVKETQNRIKSTLATINRSMKLVNHFKDRWDHEKENSQLDNQLTPDRLERGIEKLHTEMIAFYQRQGRLQEQTSASAHTERDIKDQHTNQ